jgi:dTDP-4-dehydrorhamnose reductase
LVERGTFVVRLSSSVVFDCRIARVHARHPTAPLSAYGRLQAEAEEAILGLGENASVLRLTKIITSDFPLVRNWIAALAKGDSIEAFEDHTICPLPLELAIDAATAVLEFRRGGIFQASGAGDISYADLARYLARRLGLPASRIVAVRATDRGVPENEVTSYTSMDTGRLTAMTGFTPPEPFSVLDDAFDEIITNLSKAQASRA